MRRTTVSGGDLAGGPWVRPQEGYLSRQRDPLPTHVRDLPPLDPAWAAELEPALAELQVSLEPRVRAAIEAHVRLLLRWTAAINLTAIRDPAGVARLHVADSLSALGYLRRAGIDRFVDLGSGGGFPGLPLALALPAERVLLVESVGRKAAFLKAAVEVAGATGRIEVANIRSEALARGAPNREGWPCVTARAVAGLGELVELGFPLLRPGGRLIAWKRGGLDAELSAGERAVGALGGGSLEVLPVGTRSLRGHVLVVATKGGRTPARFPRDPAERRRRPW